MTKIARSWVIAECISKSHGGATPRPLMHCLFLARGKFIGAVILMALIARPFLKRGGPSAGKGWAKPRWRHLSRWLTDFSAYTPPQNMAVIIRDVYLWIHYILEGFFLVPSIGNYMTSMRPIRTQNLIIFEHHDVKKNDTEHWHWALTLLHQFYCLALFLFVYDIVKRTFYCCQARKELGSCNI